MPTAFADTEVAYRGAGQSELIKDGAGTVQNNILGIGARGTGTTYYSRAEDGTLISERPPSAGGRRYYLYDANDSVVGLADPSGNLSTSYHYDPYGHPTNRIPLGDENPFGFGGTYMGGIGTDGVLCGPFIHGPGGRPYDPEDGRGTQLLRLGMPGLPTFVRKVVRGTGRVVAKAARFVKRVVKSPAVKAGLKSVGAISLSCYLIRAARDKDNGWDVRDEASDLYKCSGLSSLHDAWTDP